MKPSAILNEVMEKGLVTLLFVPDLPAEELLKLLMEERRVGIPKRGDDSVLSWDFYQDRDGNSVSGRGRVFQVTFWRPPEEITFGKARGHFRKAGFEGHAGAFVQWLRVTHEDLTGGGLLGVGRSYLTVPPDDKCWRNGRGNRQVPNLSYDPGDSICGPDQCRLVLRPRPFSWSVNYRDVLLGFREIN